MHTPTFEQVEPSRDEPFAGPSAVPGPAGIEIGHDSRSKDKFGSFGEQLSAVMRASRPGGSTDPRLFTRAASGLGETVSSDGGFLVQTDFSNELLKDVFQTGVLDKRDGRWVHVLMHGAYPIDRVPENYVRWFYSGLFEDKRQK